MSNKTKPSLDTLPNELIYLIFNYIDTLTIVRSIRCVCKRLYQSVNQYDKYNFDLKLINKSDFLFLFNYIKHHKIISLTLNDNNQSPGQIEYFLSLYRLKYFTKLRYLILIDIDDCYLSILLKDIQTNQLHTLIINSQRDYSQNSTISNDFLSIILLPTLKNLHINIPTFDSSQIQWSNLCQIEQLEINCLKLNQYYNIVRSLPNLKKLVLTDIDEQFHDGFHFPDNDLESFNQLDYLIIKYSHIDLIILEIILSLTPTIKYLQLMKSIDIDGFISNLTRLENFIQLKLPLLNKFEFFLIDRQIFVNNFVDISSIIKLFQTSFWIELKKWFVICDYYVTPRNILLYTSTFFDPQFELQYQSKQIYRSTSLITNNNKIILNDLKKISLDLEAVMPNATSPAVIHYF